MASAARLKSKHITRGLTLRLLMPRTLSIRMKIGSWLIGMAARVMHMPCEVEIVPSERSQRPSP